MPKGLKLPPQKQPPSNRWLEDANTDADRFRKIEILARGFDLPMWEVGERYKGVYNAIRDRNWELAEYHWDKIRVTIDVGLMKRPMRTQNSEDMFLDGPWKQMDEAIKSKDYRRMEKQLTRTPMSVAQRCGSPNADIPIGTLRGVLTSHRTCPTCITGTNIRETVKRAAAAIR